MSSENRVEVELHAHTTIGNKVKSFWLFLCCLALLTHSCKKESPYPKVIEPEDNLTTPEKVTLGEMLFFDPRLSIDNTVSCATCHVPERAFTDGKQFSDGVNGGKSMRNTPSLINVAYQPYFMFEGAIPSLERQSHVPIIDLNEMGYEKISDLVDKLAAIETYQELAQRAFNRPFDVYVLTRALASYERTLIQWDSDFDRYYFLTSLSMRQPCAVIKFFQNNCTVSNVIQRLSSRILVCITTAFTTVWTGAAGVSLVWNPTKVLSKHRV